MHHAPIRRIAFVAIFATALTSGACANEMASRSAAADVSAEDLRRLPPGRAESIPDIMLGASDNGRMLGSDSAPVRLYVISDFLCSACRIWFDSTLPRIRRQYIDSGTVQLVWVHYPLREHPAAVRAASAAMCAGVSGHFWESGRRLFASQARWGTTTVDSALIDSIATVPGLDAYAFRNCTQSNRMLRQIRGDIEFTDARKAGALPAMLVGTRLLPTGATFDALRAALDSAITAR